MDAMPKASGQPPTILELPFARRSEEKVLLWSLGIDQKDPQPSAVVLYGRGRMMGTVLKGLDISDNKLDHYLSMIGLDCECGLDRRWMTGQRVPIRWDQNTQHQVAQALEFDPENPMVKMEISRILGKGPSGNTGFDLKGQSSSNFGYREIEISLTPAKPVEKSDPVALVSEEPVKSPDITAEPEIRANQTATPPATEQSTSDNTMMVALGILAMFILGIGLSIVLRKNRNV